MLNTLNPISPRLYRNGQGDVFPGGMSMFLPLMSNLSPNLGAGGDMSITRGTEKWQQVSTYGITRFGNNVLLPTTEFLGIAANGLLVENDSAGKGWTDISGWFKVDCTITAGVTDPTGTPNSAHFVSPSADGGYTYQVSATACASKNIFASCWIRRKNGAAGSHTGGLIITDSNVAINSEKSITVTSQWQPFFHEATGAAGSGLAVAAIRPSTAQDAVDVWLPFIKVFSNSTIASLVSAGVPDDHDPDLCSYDCSADVDGSKGTFFLEFTPMFTPADGVLRYFLAIENMYGGGEYLRLYKSAGNVLFWDYNGAAITAAYALNGTNFARGVRHKLAGAYDSSGLSLYLDGVLVGSAGAFAPGVAALDAACRLQFDVAGANLPGAVIRNLRYWPKVLTANELSRMTR